MGAASLMLFLALVTITAASFQYCSEPETEGTCSIGAAIPGCEALEFKAKSGTATNGQVCQVFEAADCKGYHIHVDDTGNKDFGFQAASVNCRDVSG